MKWFVLFILLDGQVVTQEFFGEIACNRAMHELAEFGFKAFCTPKDIK